MKFSIKDFFSKCDQNCRNLLIWSHLLKKSLMVNFISCAVSNNNDSNNSNNNSNSTTILTVIIIVIIVVAAPASLIATVLGVIQKDFHR